MSTQEIGYADALSELQQILGELEAEDIDIDVLAVRVERAAELIRVCRGRINDAEVRVKEIVAGLDQEDDEPSLSEESEPCP
ncbi:MAG: exodeoxyribonuclease VII small subunit [bacterium]|nr:exodeoxyribonuclease VII small subunit [bacterium]MCY3888810.1 exodeoxyribonuclease VII small subunit [bacterium]MCY3963201.1 exodeoxyribonuclease VII small subunit [bacterium]MCY4136247.1 exodeoxyribonuclease VII small subunit [bacterium]